MSDSRSEQTGARTGEQECRADGADGTHGACGPGRSRNPFAQVLAERRRARREWHEQWGPQRAAFRARGGSKSLRDGELGPAPSGFTLLPWLLMGLGSFSNLLQGKDANPWIGGIGLFAFNSLYISVVFRAFVKEKRDAPATRWTLVAMLLITCGLAVGYGGTWLYFFPLLGLAVGSVTRGRRLGQFAIGLGVLAAGVSALGDAAFGRHTGWGALNITYATFLSTTVTAAILSLAEAVRELRAAREELARRAVEKERLRFSRDLHDLLGHTLSVIVVKSEAARRLAPRDLDSALLQITDIESVGRQALTEIREAVTGYREGSLATELDRSGSALSAAGVVPVVDRSGPPLTPQTEALLGWVVREAVTNVVRHSGASRCAITLTNTADRVRLTVADNGTGARAAGADQAHGGEADGEAVAERVVPLPGAPVPPAAPVLGGTSTGTGLKGLTERLSAAGGQLRAGPGAREGFTVTAELPTDWHELADAPVDPEPGRDRAGQPA
ncbi:histidine kinase [Streptomyces sp. NPDC008150]|uniref:sensor histidine kinase n=1 Tax=Streptomyces sp. NPDC008150 TaxID=3364816 RepID=UPI0036ED910F